MYCISELVGKSGRIFMKFTYRESETCAKLCSKINDTVALRVHRFVALAAYIASNHSQLFATKRVADGQQRQAQRRGSMQPKCKPNITLPKMIIIHSCAGLTRVLAKKSLSRRRKQEFVLRKRFIHTYAHFTFRSKSVLFGEYIFYFEILCIHIRILIREHFECKC